jgi:acetyl-CoA C-acetyltransferase
MNEKNTPIIVGLSQFTQRWEEGKMPLHPLALCQKVAEEAIADTGSTTLKAQIDGLFIVNIFGYGYEDAPAELNASMGLNAQRQFYSTFGGNTPQYLVNKICRELAAGELKVALLTGGEANYGFTKALKSGMALNWPPKKQAKKIDGDNLPGASDTANNYEMFLLTNAYPIFETALRAKAGRSVSEHRQYIGQLYEKMALMASQNPYAWSQEAYSSQDIYEASEDNRYVAFPYTKRMCANNNVDQACALILTTVGEAEKLGISPEKWVFPLAGTDLWDIWNFEQRPDLTESPAIRQATQLALSKANLQLADIQAFDIYSCFPSAVQIGRKEIGLPENDSRPYTLTGGLSLFGGPWNNYSMHAIATTVEKIRKGEYQNVMVSALGWYITKHSIGIYGKNPTSNNWLSGNYEDIQAEIKSKALPQALTQAEGEMKVLGYSLLFGRGETPNKGIVLGELATGQRAFAYIEATEAEFAQMMTIELVGKTGLVTYNEQKKRNFIKISL